MMFRAIRSGSVAAVSACAVVAFAALAPRAEAAFTITLTGTGSMSAGQLSAFTNAKATWESYITGYQPGISLTGITINASVTPIDGPSGTLANAGPTGSVFQGGFTLTTQGTMQFDSADTPANGSAAFDMTVLHEMGHVIGIGTRWSQNGVYVNTSGQYTGAAGLAAWRTEFNRPSDTYVPVELGGGAATANGHWDEVNGGNALTGITDSLGHDMRNELMTGWLDMPTFISNMTIQSLRDIGFMVVPEPSGLSVLVIGAGLAARRRRA